MYHLGDYAYKLAFVGVVFDPKNRLFRMAKFLKSPKTDLRYLLVRKATMYHFCDCADNSAFVINGFRPSPIFLFSISSCYRLFFVFFLLRGWESGRKEVRKDRMGMERTKEREGGQ